MGKITYWSWIKAEFEWALWKLHVKNYHDYCDRIYWFRHGECGGCYPFLATRAEKTVKVSKGPKKKSPPFRRK